MVGLGGRRGMPARVVVPFLRSNGATQLAAIVATHAHLDHFGGLSAVLDAFDPTYVLEPGQPVPDAGYLGFLGAVESDGAEWRPARRGDRLNVDGVAIEVLSPYSAPINGVRSPSPSRVMARSQSPTSVITIERFIMEQERLHPEATGELSNLLYDLCLAAKIISRQVRRAGLTDILGEFGAINVQGELQQKLDVFAHDTVRHSVEHTGRVCIVASEEEEEPIPVQVRADRRGGKYVLLYDPLDGSSNIDVDVSIGTIS